MRCWWFNGTGWWTREHMICITNFSFLGAMRAWYQLTITCFVISTCWVRNTSNYIVISGKRTKGIIQDVVARGVSPYIMENTLVSNCILLHDMKLAENTIGHFWKHIHHYCLWAKLIMSVFQSRYFCPRPSHERMREIYIIAYKSMTPQEKFVLFRRCFTVKGGFWCECSESGLKAWF